MLVRKDSQYWPSVKGQRVVVVDGGLGARGATTGQVGVTQGFPDSDNEVKILFDTGIDAGKQSGYVNISRLRVVEEDPTLYLQRLRELVCLREGLGEDGALEDLDSMVELRARNEDLGRVLVGVPYTAPVALALGEVCAALGMQFDTAALTFCGDTMELSCTLEDYGLEDGSSVGIAQCEPGQASTVIAYVCA